MLCLPPLASDSHNLQLYPVSKILIIKRDRNSKTCQRAICYFVLPGEKIQFCIFRERQTRGLLSHHSGGARGI